MGNNSSSSSNDRQQVPRRWALLEPETVALFHACEQCDFLTVSRIVGKSTDVNVRDRQQKTPLHLAAMRGDTRVVQLLLAAGADPNAPNSYGATPLVVASGKNHRDAAELLIRAGADVNATTIFEACNTDSAEVLDLLMKHGHQTRDILTANVGIATRTVSPSCLGVLLDAGADPNGTSEGRKRVFDPSEPTRRDLEWWARAPLHVRRSTTTGACNPKAYVLAMLSRATMRQSDDALRRFGAPLLQAIKIISRSKKARYDRSARYERDGHKVLDLLLAHGAYPNVQTRHGRSTRSMLAVAITQVEPRVVASLTAAGATVEKWHWDLVGETMQSAHGLKSAHLLAVLLARCRHESEVIKQGVKQQQQQQQQAPAPRCCPCPSNFIETYFSPDALPLFFALATTDGGEIMDEEEGAADDVGPAKPKRSNPGLARQLCRAVHFGHIEAIKILLVEGQVDPDERIVAGSELGALRQHPDYPGYVSAALIAAGKVKIQVLRWMVAFGADASEGSAVARVVKGEASARASEGSAVARVVKGEAQRGSAGSFAVDFRTEVAIDADRAQEIRARLRHEVAVEMRRWRQKLATGKRLVVEAEDRLETLRVRRGLVSWSPAMHRYFMDADRRGIAVLVAALQGQGQGGLGRRRLSRALSRRVLRMIKSGWFRRPAAGRIEGISWEE